MFKNSHTLKFAAIALVAMVALTFAFSSCNKSGPSAQKVSEADSLITAALDAADYERLLELCDSLEQTGDISPIVSANFRGHAYMQLGDYRHAEEVLKPVMDMKPTNSYDSAYYISCVCSMADMLTINKNFEGVLRIGLPLMEKMKDTEGMEKQFFGHLSQYVGTAQLALGMKDDAAKSFDLSFNFYQKICAEFPDWQSIYSIFISAFNNFVRYQETGDYESAAKWYHRQDSTVAVILKRDDVPASVVDHLVAANCIARAELAIGQKKMAEANRAIADYKKTEKSKTVEGQIDGAQVLLEAKRYAEAADGFALLDQCLAEHNQEPSLENLNEYPKYKFEANYKAGRRDSALAVAAYIVENLDSAIAKQKESDAAEMATVYQTQQKDAEIAQQQIELSRQRWIGTLVALVLLTTFFIIYTWYRRRAANRLGEAHVKLQNAYNQLEETTAAKERIESELRIARDIQLSMVPNNFPQYEGLDMYAEMNAAKEVGGDLYGYVLQGNKLHFCLGDVSGKGVPASLFMSQSARLFRTLATEGMTPVDIAIRMNNELAENNDRGMFVTMFIGMLHLDTGQLDFCNCGHNAPVIDGEFLKMQYDNQPLGLWEDDPFEGETIEDIRGQQLLIYTDGLNEAENAQKQLLGNAKLLELMADTQGMTSHEVIEKLKSAVEAHRAGAEPNDDLTLMCITLKK